MSVKFLFKEAFPSRVKRFVGEVRSIDGQPAFFHCQHRGKTNTRIRKYPCPMTVPAIIIPTLQALDVKSIYVRLPGEPSRVLMTRLTDMLAYGPRSLGCELQFFLPWRFWKVVPSSSITFQPSRTEWKTFVFPAGTLGGHRQIGGYDELR